MVFRLPVTLPPVLRDLIPGVITGPEVEPVGLRVLVTGASGTFGREISRSLTARGAVVVGLDVSPRPDDVIRIDTPQHKFHIPHIPARPQQQCLSSGQGI